MAEIPWVEVYRRKSGTDDDYEVIQSYPFPDAVFGNTNQYLHLVSISVLRNWLEDIEDDLMRLCQLTRLSFIQDIWHPTDFMQVRFKDWKYK